MKPHPAFLLLPFAGFIWAVDSQDAYDVDYSSLQREYAEEQNKIDLALAEMALKAAQGTVTGEEAQEQLDAWMVTNRERMETQVAKAAILDEVAPLEPVPVAEPAYDTPVDARLKELAALEELRVNEMRATAQSGEHFQEMFDTWFQSAEGKAFFAERNALFTALPGFQPLGTQTFTANPPEGASHDELAVAGLEERIAMRIQSIRDLHPSASPEEMQRLIDGSKQLFDADYERIAVLQSAIGKTRLEAEVLGLREAVAKDEPLAQSGGGD